MKCIVIAIALLTISIPTFADLGGVESWNTTEGLGPYGEKGKSGHVRFIDVDTVAFKSQDMKVVFRYPNTIEVESDYIFDVLKPNQKITVAYIFDTYTTHDWSDNFDELSETEIKVRGKRVRIEDVTLVGSKTVDFDSDFSGDTAIIFPINFGETGECPVSISYSYTILSESDLYFTLEYVYGGFEYSFVPAKYWAGGVDRITVDFEMIGGEVGELGKIVPNDFKFTKNGCRWVWKNLEDNDILSDERDLELEVYFDGDSIFDDEFHTVISDAGLNVRSGPGISYDIVGTVKRDGRVFMFADGQTTDKHGNTWNKCRTLDNTVGYACIEYDGEYLVDCYYYGKRIMEAMK